MGGELEEGKGGEVKGRGRGSKRGGVMGGGKGREVKGRGRGKVVGGRKGREGQLEGIGRSS